MRKMYKTIEIQMKESLEWWQLISENRSDGFSHSHEDGDFYNEAPKAFLT